MADATLRYTSMDSPVGPLWLCATPEGLAAIDWAKGRDEAAVLHDWEARMGRRATRDDAALARYTAGLRRYFDGDAEGLDLPVDIQEGTPFQRKVWQALLRIPYGETRSYRWLAEQVDSPNGFRAVGAANGRNPVSLVVPCHRVVNQGGGLGGYGGGMDNKRLLLDLEHADPVASAKAHDPPPRSAPRREAPLSP